MKIDWKRKLTSRKFWAAVVGFVTPALLAFGVADDTITQVTGLIMSCGTLVAYIIAEGLTDAASVKNTDETSTETDNEVTE